MVRREVRSEETLPEALTPSLCLLYYSILCNLFCEIESIELEQVPREYSNHNHLELSLELRHLGSLSLLIQRGIK